MNSSINLITNSNNFSQTVKFFFSTKLKHKEIVNLVENETILQNDKSVAGTFYNYFRNIFKNLSFPIGPCFEEQTSNLCLDKIKTCVEKCERYSLDSFVLKMKFQI